MRELLNLGATAFAIDLHNTWTFTQLKPGRTISVNWKHSFATTNKCSMTASAKWVFQLQLCRNHGTPHLHSTK